MEYLVLKGEKYQAVLKGEIVKEKKSEDLYCSFISKKYTAYQYIGKGIVINKITNKKFPFSFKTPIFKDYWTDSLYSFKDAIINYEQDTLFYKRFYEDSEKSGIISEKLPLIIDLILSNVVS
jgi:hypothetical protein